jgi:hypothetical protein
MLLLLTNANNRVLIQGGAIAACDCGAGAACRRLDQGDATELTSSI